jgi:uncharacterized coiled-coil DUF342 family protein
MQLEKVTSRSHEAAIAGWISSNDVTLFTTVLVVVIAMFLHARLSKGARENVEVTKQKDLLAQRLESTASELDVFHSELDKTRQALNLTQEERDQLRQQLVEKLAAIAELNAKLDAMLRDVNVLQSEQQSLTKEKADLLAERALLAEDRSSLRTSNASLQERLEAIGAQLEAKIAALTELEKERDRLKKQADELDAIVATLKARMEALNIDLAETKAQSNSALAESAAKVRELGLAITERDKQAEEYLARLKRAAELFEGLKTEKQHLERSLSEAELKRQQQLIEEGRRNRELLELNGRLERVAILFDASGSMKQAAAVGAGDRWAEAQEIASTWLEHLPVQQLVLIVFGSNVRTFPADGTLADVRGQDGTAKRSVLMQNLKGVTPEGWTSTLDALRKAYQYKVDTIILFSDGAPSPPNSGRFDPAIARQIYDLCRAHPNIPVHTVGLGNYFDQNASTFMQTVAKITGGTFRGR